MGPPGSNRRAIALELAEHFKWEGISVTDLLQNEVKKKSEYGKAIRDSQKNYRYGRI